MQAALGNLSWHGRMVFSPMFNTMSAGILFSFIGIQTLEHFASTIGSQECTDSVMGVLLLMPSGVFETMWVGMAAFIAVSPLRNLPLLAISRRVLRDCLCFQAAVFNLRLSTVHFEALTKGYVAFFRGTQSLKSQCAQAMLVWS